MRHYVCTDLHGMKEYYDDMMEVIRASNEDYQLFFLGDAADRGPDGYELIKLLLDDPHVTYLKGNHEDLFVKAAREFNHNRYYKYGGSIEAYVNHYGGHVNKLMHGYDMSLYRSNGGVPTFEAWIKDGAPMDIITRLDKLPLKYSYGEYDMCHAGCDIHSWETNNEEQLVWNRRHFHFPWYKNRILIHGHTPVPYLIEEMEDEEANPKKPYTWIPGAVFDLPMDECGRKVDLDCGCFFTGVFAFMDLDTMEIFVTNEEEN